MSESPAAIEIREADREWPNQFAEVARRLRAALGGRALRIDHIGSTAVPGLPAKPIIDVQVTLGALDGLREPLEAAGFTWRTIDRDHRPPGNHVPDRELEKRFVNGDDPPSNVHLRVEGTFNQRYALLCRDYLRTHPRAAHAYAELKRNLARVVGSDVAAYYAVKDPAFDILMAAAEAWADATGWRPGPSDA